MRYFLGSVLTKRKETMPLDKTMVRKINLCGYQKIYIYFNQRNSNAMFAFHFERCRELCYLFWQEKLTILLIVSMIIIGFILHTSGYEN